MKRASLLIFASLISALTGNVLVAQQPASQAVPAPVPAVAAPAVPPDQQPTKEQLARLFELMHVREQTAIVRRTMTGLLQQQMHAQINGAEDRANGGKITQQQQAALDRVNGGKITQEQQAALDRVMDRFVEKAMTLYTIDEMLDDITGIYQRHFTREDVDAYIAFYSSPAGQHFLEIVPIITREYVPLVTQRTQERSLALIPEFTKEINDVMKSSAPAAAAPAKPAPAGKPPSD